MSPISPIVHVAMSARVGFRGSKSPKSPPVVHHLGVDSVTVSPQQSGFGPALKRRNRTSSCQSSMEQEN